jgi:SRSO17 transposase
LELALQIIRRVRDQGVPFVAVDFDSLYGRKGWLRDELNREQMEYYADIPATTQVYLQAPLVYWPTTKRGKPAKKATVVGLPYPVNQLLDHSQTEWQTLNLRPNERGFLIADFARHRVWTVRDDGSLRAEWLLIRRDAGDVTYSLSNAPLDTTLPTMAERKSQRALIERSNQDAKSELGWDEFQAIKYRAWQHHLAFTILASWFITETKLDWAQQYTRSPKLLTHYQTDVLPTLSVANIRTLLQAALPLPQLDPYQAAQLVIKHLDNRTRSRKSRLRNALSP